jgi:hypothetical protein
MLHARRGLIRALDALRLGYYISMNSASELKTRIEQRIKQLVENPAADPVYQRHLAVRHSVLPLWGDLDCTWALNRDGEIIAFPDGISLDMHIEDDPLRRNTALVQGSKLYPEIAALIPARPSDAQTCPDCNGSGMNPVTSNPKYAMVICLCGGTGWLPANFKVESDG